MIIGLPTGKHPSSTTCPCVWGWWTEEKKVCNLFPTLSNLTYPSQVVNNDGETRVRKCQCLPSHKTVRVFQPHILNGLGQGEHLLTGRNLLTTPGNYVHHHLVHTRGALIQDLQWALLGDHRPRGVSKLVQLTVEMLQSIVTSIHNGYHAAAPWVAKLVNLPQNLGDRLHQTHSGLCSAWQAVTGLLEVKLKSSQNLLLKPQALPLSNPFRPWQHATGEGTGHARGHTLAADWSWGGPPLWWLRPPSAWSLLQR